MDDAVIRKIVIEAALLLQPVRVRYGFSVDCSGQIVSIVEAFIVILGVGLVECDGRKPVQGMFGVHLEPT